VLSEWNFAEIYGQSESTPMNAPMGWGTFSHMIPNPALTHIAPQSTFFGY